MVSEATRARVLEAANLLSYRGIIAPDAADVRAPRLAVDRYARHSWISHSPALSVASVRGGLSMPTAASAVSFDHVSLARPALPRC